MSLEQMRAAVFAQKPVFKRVISQHGSSRLFDYFSGLGTDYRPKNVPRRRQNELIRVLYAKTKTILGKQAADALTRYLKKRYVVSTAAHHDFATHPFFVNYLVAAGYANTAAELSVVPVLSCAGISLNNSSFPRGLLLHDKDLKQQRLKLVSLKNHHHPVYGYPGYDATAIAQVERAIHNLALPLKTKTKLIALMEATLGGQTLKQIGLDNQITLAVSALFKKIPGLSKTEVVYLPQEEIAISLFLKYHLKHKTVINRIVFDEKIRNLFLKKFEGITGAHDTRRKIGTQLFWGLNKTGRVALRVSKNRLVSANTSINISLTPSALRKALLAKRLMPSMSFTLTLLSFYYGLACAGGFSQVGYLTEMKSAYLSLLDDIRDTDTETAITRAVPTDLFAGEFILATLGTKKVAATALDIALRPNIFTKSHLRKLMNTTTLKQAVDRMMPELYKIIRS